MLTIPDDFVAVPPTMSIATFCEMGLEVRAEILIRIQMKRHGHPRTDRMRKRGLQSAVERGAFRGARNDVPQPFVDRLV